MGSGKDTEALHAMGLTMSVRQASGVAQPLKVWRRERSENQAKQLKEWRRDLGGSFGTSKLAGVIGGTESA